MTSPARTYDLHGICLQASSPDDPIRRRLDAIFAPFSVPPRPADIQLEMRLVEALAPWEPAGQLVAESFLLRCARQGDLLSAHFPQWGTLTVNLALGLVWGDLLASALGHYGAFDDMIIIGLGPLLRRRGFFSLHAFAAAQGDRAVLLVGDMGTGKTTTGLSLLDAGWKLLSNDSPLLSQRGADVVIHAYPGLLAAYDDTLTRFSSLHRFRGKGGSARAKQAFAAHEAYADVWQGEAPAFVLLFPGIVPRLPASRAEPLSAQDALLALLPNSIERWDREYIAPHLAILQALVQQAPAYRLLLADDVPALPGLIADLLAART